MNRFLTNKKMIILLISVLIFILLITFSLHSRGANVIQSGSNDVMAVVGRLFSKPTKVVLNAADAMNDVQNTYEENQRLKKQINAISEKDATIAALKDENQQLKEELGVKDLITEYTLKSGSVISRNPDQWIDQVIIDLGTTDDIEVGMPVMNKNGLVGVISEANLTSSKVTLISNVDISASKVSSEIVIGDEGVVHGIISEYKRDTNELIMNQITSDLEVSPGDLVTTSGLGGAYPRGLVIGEVEEVRLDEQGLQTLIHIKPLGDFNNMRVISVVKRSAETVFSDQDKGTNSSDDKKEDSESGSEADES